MLAEITREIERELDKKTAGKERGGDSQPTLPQVDPDGVIRSK
jgi:hypothetical protein